ncbi:ASCH domain protein [compost metagenome]
MRTITILQPWASLIALGEKQFETRSWPTKYRGPVAIHAGKRLDRQACLERSINDALVRNGITEWGEIPLGAVVAIAELKNCLKSIDTWTDGYILENLTSVYAPEHEFGDFTPGRFAWEMTDVKRLAEPIPAKGQQGLWNWAYVQ